MKSGPFSNLYNWDIFRLYLHLDTVTLTLCNCKNARCSMLKHCSLVDHTNSFCSCFWWHVPPAVIRTRTSCVIALANCQQSRFGKFAKNPLHPTKPNRLNTSTKVITHGSGTKTPTVVHNLRMSFKLLAAAECHGTFLGLHSHCGHYDNMFFTRRKHSLRWPVETWSRITLNFVLTFQVSWKRYLLI
jgi:hypothetical protein